MLKLKAAVIEGCNGKFTETPLNIQYAIMYPKTSTSSNVA